MSSKQETEINCEHDEINSGPEKGRQEVTISFEQSQSIKDAITHNVKAILYCLAMSMSPVVYGFDLIIVTLITAMPSFQFVFGDAVEGHFLLPAMWLSLWTSMTSVGVMLGALSTGPLSDRFGRRVSIYAGGVIAIVGNIVCYFADHASSLLGRRSTFLAGKIIIGVALGFFLPASQTYVSEVAPLKVRGPLLSLFTLFVVIGQIIAVSGVKARIAILSVQSYRILLIVGIVLAILAVVLAFLSPESPSLLLQVGKRDAAVKAASRLYKKDVAAQHVDTLEATLEHERTVKSASAEASWAECFRGTNWRRTRIVFYANALQQFVGIAMIINATYFLQLGGLSPASSILVTTISLSCSAVALIISWYTMTVYGRRAILLASTGAIAMLWLAIGIAGCFRSTNAFWAVGCLMVVVQFAYGLGVGSAYPVVAGETSTLRVRAKTQSLGFFIQFLFNWAFNFCVPYMYIPNEGDLGGKVGFVFAALSALAFVVLFIEVPETKDRTFEQLDLLFEKKLKARHFKKTIL